MSAISAAVYGLEGTVLTPEETAFLRRFTPLGIILFARNITDKKQLKALLAETETALGYKPLVLIDQEGGRVARLPVPEWPAMRPAADYRISEMDSEEEAMDNALAFGREAGKILRESGVNVNCAPVCDLDLPEGHNIIGDRAFGCTPEEVIEVAGAYATGLMQEGVMPVLKHIPGHGRAQADSHEELPVIHTKLSMLEKTDFAVFKALHDFPAAMTAHCVYTCLDGENPASASPVVIHYIRESLNFGGCLISDDIGMKALEGSFADRAADVLAAGCDIALHCSGNIEEMRETASAVPPAGERALRFLRLAAGDGRTENTAQTKTRAARVKEPVAV